MPPEDFKKWKEIVTDFYAKHPNITILVLVSLVVVGATYFFYSPTERATAYNANSQIAVSKNETQQVSAPVNTASNSNITANNPIAIHNYITEKPLEEKINQETVVDSRGENLEKLNQFRTYAAE